MNIVYYYFRDSIMKNITIDYAKKNFENLVKMCLFDAKSVKIHCDKGNVVLLSEDCYRSIYDSIFVLSHSDILDDIEDAKRTPSNELILKAPWEK